jgi:hypothetical protein
VKKGADACKKFIVELKQWTKDKRQTMVEIFKGLSIPYPKIPPVLVFYDDYEKILVSDDEDDGYSTYSTSRNSLKSFIDL